MKDMPSGHSYAPHADVNLDAAHVTDEPTIAFFGENIGDMISLPARAMAMAVVRPKPGQAFAQLALAPRVGLASFATHAAMDADKCRRVAAALISIANDLDGGRGRQ